MGNLLRHHTSRAPISPRWAVRWSFVYAVGSVVSPSLPLVTVRPIAAAASGLLIAAAASSVAAQATLNAMPHAARRQAVLARLENRVMVVPSRDAFKTDDQAGFKQATDFQYFTGLSDLVGAVLAFDGALNTVTLFLPAPSPVITRPRPGVDSASVRRAGMSEVLPIDSLEPWVTRRFGRLTAILVSSTDARGAVRAPIPMAGNVARWAAYFSSLGFRGDVSSATPVVRALREIKDAAEVGILARVGKSSGDAMLAGMRALGPGRTQRDVESAIVASCIRAGGIHSFWPWAMSGPRGVYTDLFNSFVDPDNHNRTMRAGELVRVDVGCQLEQYMGDVGRTAPVSGRFSRGQREAWDVFIAGYLAGLAVVRDGVRVAEVFAVAQQKIRALEATMTTELGKRAAGELLSARGVETWQFHNVGLDDAEGAPPVLKTGMVLAYELMFAVGDDHFYLEDILLVEPNGHRMLTPHLPYTAAEVERAMRRTAGTTVR